MKSFGVAEGSADLNDWARSRSRPFARDPCVALAEVRRRAEELLDKKTDTPNSTSDEVRSCAIIECLAQLGTAEVSSLL